MIDDNINALQITSFRFPDVSTSVSDEKTFMNSVDTALLSDAIRHASLCAEKINTLAGKMGIPAEKLSVHYGNLTSSLHHAQTHMACITILSVKNSKQYVTKKEIPPKMKQVLNKAMESATQNSWEVPAELMVLGQDMLANAA
jgi:hypothetical protein